MYSYSERAKPNSNLENFAEKALKGWIPAQIDVVKSIGSKIETGAYGNSPTLLIEDLKKDISTYLFIIRAFMDKSTFLDQAANQKFESSFNILIPLLESIERNYADDRIKNASEYQLELLKESILTSTTVEALSTSFSLDKGFAYSISSLKSLGKLLLAWNFPTQFNAAIEVLKASPENTSLETVLTNLFGFSPSQLGASVAQKMGFKSGVYNLLQNPSQVIQTSNSKTSIHNRLSSLCGIGEQFAMAHSTLPHNVSEKSLKEIVTTIENSIGKNGLKTIYTRYNVNLDSYSQSIPSSSSLLIDLSSVADTDPSNFSFRTEILRLANMAHITNLNLLNEIISDFLSPPNRSVAIKRLVSELLPNEGVDAIVLYTLDPVEKDLVPICKKGHPSFIKIKDACPIFGTMANSLIQDVFDSKNHHVVEGLNSKKQEIVAHLIPYPHKKPYGVIYSEAIKEKINKTRLGALNELVVTFLSKLYAK
jgi:hypothetical protein